MFAQYMLKLAALVVGEPSRFRMESSDIETLRAKLVELNEDARTIQNHADAESRALTEDEDRQLTAIFNEFERVEKDLQRRQKMIDNEQRLNAPRGRQLPVDVGDPNQNQLAPRGSTSLQVPNNARIDVVDRLPRGHWGFNNMGEFSVAVRRAANPNASAGQVDPRLTRLNAAPTSYGNENTGPDGGFLVPPDFRNDIMTKVLAENTLLSRVDQIPIAGNSFMMPVDETTPWQTSGGIQAYWEGEGDVGTQSKPSFTTKQVRANKITALVGMTEEMLEDAPAIDAYLRRKAPEKINFKLDTAIVSGNGVGKPLGILNSAALVTVTKESSQAADTLLMENVVKMYSRMYAPLLGSSIWLMNQDVMPQLLQINSRALDVAGSQVYGGQPMYIGPGQLSQAPNGMLLGRPIVYTQACPTLGDLGDVIFADMSQYLAVIKGGIKADTSMHLWFDYGITAYRFSLRIGGNPWWGSTITPASGSSNTLGCFIALQAR